MSRTKVQLVNNIVGNVSGGASFTGIITATGGVQGIGIYSGGSAVHSGVITALNFVGTGNTFAVHSNRIDISIAGGGTNIFTILSRSGAGITVSAPASTLTVYGRTSNTSISI